MKPQSHSLPVPLDPVAGSAVDTLAPTFQWQLASGPESYRLQIAADELFDRVLFDARVGGTDSLTVYDLPLPGNGSYFWRVQATRAEAWSEAAVFQVGRGSSGPSARRQQAPASATARPAHKAANDDAGVLPPPYLTGSTSHTAVMATIMVMLFTVVLVATIIWIGTPGY